MKNSLLVVGVLAASGIACHDHNTAPIDPLKQIPSFVYVSNQNGSDQLFTYSDGTAALLPGSIAGDADPQSANGRIYFTSFRASANNSEIFTVKNDGSDLQRLTTNQARDLQPTPSPDGSRIVFVSLRTGTAKLWAIASDGSNPVELVTGSDDFTPEGTPRYSPDGTQILFNSARTNTSQLFLMPAAGDSATQLTHEANGAFDGSWSYDGKSVFYVDGGDRSKLHQIVIATGVVTNYALNGTDLSQPVCTKTQCLVVSGRSSGAGDIYDYIGPLDSLPLKVVGTSGNERQPALLVP